MNTDISVNEKLKVTLAATYKSLDEKQAGKRLFEKDPHLWKTEPEQVKSINNRLGWLDSPQNFTERCRDLIAFANEIKAEGYKHAVLLGMGGSSLCSEVARQTFGSTNGFPELLVLDNTDPTAIKDVESRIDPAKTLFITASKSGNTMETLSFSNYFYNELKKKTEKPGANFIAITDAGTPLVKLAQEQGFRRTFINPGDIGGRYSVLTDFGLVPMALMGIDIGAVLAYATQMQTNCKSISSADANPGVSLGAVLGACQQQGRDKVTFVLSSSIHSFGLWAEQLLAESTGKEGKGVIPVSGEQLGGTEVYGNDRLFVHIYLPTDNTDEEEKKLKDLETAGHPVVRIKIENKAALGGEFYGWEIATAIAGVVIGINPFDEPNVAEGKANTNQLLEEWTKNGSFQRTEPLVNTDGISIYEGKAATPSNGKSVGDFIESFASRAKSGDYIALLPYFLETDSRTKVLQAWRHQMRNDLKVATTLLHGPRYLHSTGQLHKGGPATGLYIILIGDGTEDLPIPNQKFGFGTLHMAQALGDFRSLNDKGRGVIRIHLGKDVDAGLEKLWEAVQTAEKSINQPVR